MSYSKPKDKTKTPEIYKQLDLWLNQDLSYDTPRAEDVIKPIVPKRCLACWFLACRCRQGLANKP